MNRIFEKLRSKRRYIRKPMCANISGICTFEKCRCGYANDLKLAASGKKPKVVLAIIEE